ncbi:hypothetical protein CkaCkLH20_03975 [Colletotrichum karsti]|uniref:phospholipase A2 n=1 Tax=Colletotrichum karsti TaxID=1095194 RepID=A0A9P6I728_9PEZI|nr:uncharacterized protein CkaCkLH20_03975 [Colletotrichum karsti]KAF9878483.1 hypothetical protein CkaCkLH20_03975 [Colletotrichum karsti]
MLASGPAKPRVLCLDGGGIRGLSEVLILKELMLQVRIRNDLDYTPEPNQCFDFICGTSTGGLLAVLLGRLGKTLDECETLFREFGSRIFSGGSFSRALRMVSTGSKHTSEGLSGVIRSQVGGQKMHEVDGASSGHVPVAVIAVSRSTRHSYMFRTYGTRASIEACPIVDACLATSAATTCFPSITINGIEYIDGAVRDNNPTDAALKELESAESPLPLRDAVSGVGCLVSIGTGLGSYGRESSGAISKLVPQGFSSVKNAAKMCIKIATDCHEAHLEIKDKFEKGNAGDAYYRFDVDRGLESVMLNESDSEALQHITAVTRAYLRRRQTKMEQCALAIKPRRKIESIEPPMYQALGFGPSSLVYPGLPESTATFFGRSRELSQLQTALDPLRPSRKNALLFAVGGSGKTQLALRHIHEERGRYSAIIWINASTKASAEESIEEVAAAMRSSWPRDTPMLPAERDANSLVQVKSRLRCTRHRNWLLVIDSADDPERNDLAKYIPRCDFGSVLVTSTRRRACIGFRPESPIHLDGLDFGSSHKLLLTSARLAEIPDDLEPAKAIIKELSGIPLAIEQAGGLILNGEFTLPDFLDEYRENYRALMELHLDEGTLSYEKDGVILTILDMTYRHLSIDPKQLFLLNFIGVLGSWQIPMSLLDNFEFFGPNPSVPNTSSAGFDNVQDILGKPGVLRLTLRRLASFSLIRLKEDGNHIAAHGLARAVCKRNHLTSISSQLELDGSHYEICRTYLTPLRHQLSLIKEHLSDQDLNPHDGQFRTPNAIILRQSAWADLSEGLADRSKDLFRKAITYEAIRDSQAGFKWPNDEMALDILCGFSRACHTSGDLNQAIESMESAVRLSERFYGNESEVTLHLVSRLRYICERREIMQQHHKAALLASTTTRYDSAGLKLSRRSTRSHEDHLQHFESRSESEWNADNLVREIGNLGQDLLDAARSGNAIMTRLFLDSPDIHPKTKSVHGKKLLHTAVQHDQPEIVRLLLDQGVDVDSANRRGWTPLFLATRQRQVSPLILGFLLDHGADPHRICDGFLSILEYDLFSGSQHLFRCIMGKGSCSTLRDSCGRTLLHIVVEHGTPAALASLLRSAPGLDVDAQRDNGDTALHEACKSRRHSALQAATILLGAGARCDISNNDGRTTVDIATINDGRTAVDNATITRNYGIKRILHAKPGGHRKANLTWSNMSVAEVVVSESLQILKQRLRKATRGDLDASSASYGTPLHQACGRGLPFVEVLLKAGADPNVVDSDNQTPLYAMLRHRTPHTECIKALIDHGADTDKMPDAPKSLTLWERACQAGHWPAALELLRRCRHINPKSSHVRRVLSQASIRYSKMTPERVVELLKLDSLELKRTGSKKAPSGVPPALHSGGNTIGQFELVEEYEHHLRPSEVLLQELRYAGELLGAVTPTESIATNF